MHIETCRLIDDAYAAEFALKSLDQIAAELGVTADDIPSLAPEEVAELSRAKPLEFTSLAGFCDPEYLDESDLFNSLPSDVIIRFISFLVAVDPEPFLSLPAPDGVNQILDRAAIALERFGAVTPAEHLEISTKLSENLSYPSAFRAVTGEPLDPLN